MPDIEPPRGAEAARVAGALTFYANPLNWPALVARVARNPHFFADLLEYAQADPSARRSALLRLKRHLYRRALEGDLLEWRSSTKGFASDLLQENAWLETQLRNTRHRGALRVQGPNATRLDYALLINHQLLTLKQEFAGYGLGRTGALVLPSGRALTPLEIAQAWSLLTNAGHLFGTFATERALLFELVRDQGHAQELLSEIHEKLRPHAEAIVAGRGLSHFYYALACWRVSRAQMPPMMREDCVRLLEHFMETRRQTPPPVHMWAFRRARQLAYNRMHLYMSIGHPVDAVHEDHTIRALSPWAELGYDAHAVEESSLLSTMLDALDAYQWESYFASAEVASDVLAHVRGFKRWWRSRTTSLPESVDELFGGAPAGWQAVDRADLKHFARVHLPGRSMDWVEEVHHWLADPDAWLRGNVIVSARSGDGLVGDIYTRADTAPDPRLLRQSALQLARHCEASWSASPTRESRELWRSIAVFGARALALTTRSGRSPIVRPIQMSSSNAGHVGYAIASTQAISGLQHALRLLDSIDDLERRRERQAAISVAMESANECPDAPMIFVLGRVYLVEEKRTQVELAEFDGAWCFFEENRMRWFLFEHKQRTGADRDLRKKTKNFRGTPRIQSVSASVTGQASVAIVDWEPSILSKSVS